MWLKDRLIKRREEHWERECERVLRPPSFTSFLRSGSHSTLHSSIQSFLQVISRIADDRSLTVLRNGSLSFRHD